jgi:ABC-type dipeptide/oligopeptide/nickel transport system permease component
MRYLVQRALHGLGVVVGVSFLVFALTWLRGDPVAVLVPLDTPPAEVERLRHSLGLDRPFPVQYVDFVLHAVRGDFGTSLRLRTPALPLVLERLPATLFLVSSALLFALALAIPLGALGAMAYGRLPDVIARAVALVGQSLAAPWIGLLLIFVFAVELRWLPSSGLSRPDGVIMPAIVAGLYPAAGLLRLLRAGLLEVLSTEYIRTARAKGLADRLILGRHAFKNAALPTLTFLGLQIAFLFGNSVVAEALFAYPGMGHLAVDAIAARDVPVIQAFVTLVAVVVVLANVLVDALYVWLDPRIRLA